MLQTKIADRDTRAIAIAILLFFFQWDFVAFENARSKPRLTEESAQTH